MQQIIIIEDDQIIREELQIFLSKYGYEIKAPTEFNNIVDYIISHSPSTSELYLIGGVGLYETDVLTNYLEEIKATTNYKKHFFGHMHVDQAINSESICLYEQIIRII